MMPLSQTITVTDSILYDELVEQVDQLTLASFAATWIQHLDYADPFYRQLCEESTPATKGRISK